MSGERKQWGTLRLALFRNVSAEISYRAALERSPQNLADPRDYAGSAIRKMNGSNVDERVANVHLQNLALHLDRANEHPDLFLAE